ncbi:hypothetical protein QTP88_003464 [Uroleucon formosanum]
MGRVTSSHCWQCADESDTAEHTLFMCAYWAGFREPLTSRLGRRLCTADVPDIICGPSFDTLPTVPAEKYAALKEAEEVFRLYYQMVKNILTAKEEEKRWQQAAVEGPPEAPILRTGDRPVATDCVCIGKPINDGARGRSTGTMVPPQVFDTEKKEGTY